MGINEKIDEIIQQAKQEKIYMEALDIFEQEIYDQGFRNAIYFMLWNPSERSCSNCQYQRSRELCGEERNGRLFMISSLGLKVNLFILDVHASGIEVKEI